MRTTVHNTLDESYTRDNINH